MLDSIVFRIHDLQKHAQLYKFLDRQGVTGSSIKGKKYDNPENVPAMFERKIYMKQIFVDYESGKTQDFVYRNHLPSHHSDLAYSINIERNFIEFNFSIPKYLYGTNVFQFVRHHFDKDYFSTRFSTIEQIQDLIYDDLRAFLTWFFEKELNGLVNLYFVQLVRLDICYNKIFNTQKDAEIYLQDLVRIKKKYVRTASPGMKVYHGTIYYVPEGSGYTWKIYPKGAEFRKHDRSKLKKRGWENSLIENVQALADRMLRFEIEIKTGLMSQLFTKHIFRKNQKEWIDGMKIYNSISSNGYFTVNKKKLIYADLDTYRKKCFKYAKFYLNKTWHFCLESDSAAKELTSQAIQEFETGKFPVFVEEREQRFNLKLFRLMMGKFQAAKNEFTIDSRNPFDHFINEIGVTSQPPTKQNQYFKDWLLVHKGIKLKKLTFNSVNRMAQRLKVETWSEIEHNRGMSESSFFRLKRLFKQLDFHNSTTVIIAISDEKKGAFLEYHQAIESIVTNHYFKRFIRPF
jgi:hypothetical protein